MNKKTKTILIILVVLFIILAIFVKILGTYEEKEPVPVSIPSGNLSDSLFVLQNNTYIAQDSMPTLISFGKIPYSIDMVNNSHVSVGNGYVFSLSQGYLTYVTCIPKNEVCAVMLKQEYAKSILINTIPEMANCSLLREETGFLNGFEVAYSVYELGITDNVSINYSYIVGYRLSVPDWDYDLYMGVSTMTYDTETLQNCKEILDMLVYTVRYNEERAVDIRNNVALSTTVTQDTQHGEESSGITPTQAPTASENELPEGASTQEHLVVLKQDYVNLRIEIAWSNSYSNVEMMLYDPTKTYFYTPVSCADGSALFYVGQVAAGTYYLEITGADYGEVSMTLKDGE